MGSVDEVVYPIIGVGPIHHARQVIQFQTGGEARERAASPPPAPARVVRYLRRYTPTAAAVDSPPPLGNGASRTSWAVLPIVGMGGGDLGDDEMGMQLLLAGRAPTATLRRCRGLRLPIPPLSRAPTDGSPLTHRAERPTLRAARRLRAPLRKLFLRFGLLENVWVCGVKKRDPVHTWSLKSGEKRPTARCHFLGGWGVL
jgi:hypothetical protein